jgi:hypothetical protein
MAITMSPKPTVPAPAPKPQPIFPSPMKPGTRGGEPAGTK